MLEEERRYAYEEARRLAYFMVNVQSGQPIQSYDELIGVTPVVKIVEPHPYYLP